MPSYLLKVHRKMTIAAHRRVLGALEGEYSSVYKGRSMDFDDLRTYVPGDDVKDIDWKATARGGQVLIKRYVAIRKHNIMLVVDTGRSMAATSPSGDSKRDIAFLAAGVIAYVAQQHGDLVGLTAGASQGITHMPLKGSRAHIEHILQHVHTHINLQAPSSDLGALLDYVKRAVKRRTLLIVISDNLNFVTAQEQLLRRLAAQHEIVFIAVDDVDPSDNNWSPRSLYDVNQSVVLPSFVRRQTVVEDAYQSLLKSEWKRTNSTLEHLRISSVRIKSEAEVISQIVRLLEKHKHAKR
jgi:uncharacterized protein (DUF58 family)